MCKKVIKWAGALALAVVMVLALLPMPTSLAATTDVAVGDLQAEINSAASGDTLVLAAGTHTGPISIPAGKSLTIQGPASGTATISAAAGNAVTINGADPIHFENIVIETTAAAGIGVFSAAGVAPQIYFKDCVINTKGRGISMNGFAAASDPPEYLENVVIELDNTQIYNTDIADYDTQTAIDGSKRGISIFDAGAGSVVTLENGSSINGFGYGINMSGWAQASTPSAPADAGGLTINIIASTIKSWGGLNIWTANTVFNIRGSTLLGINTSTSSGNGFATIVLNNGIYAPDGKTPPANVFTISNTTITNYMPDPAAAATNGVTQQLVRVENQGETEFTLTDVTFEDTTGTIDSAFFSATANGQSAMSDEQLAAYVNSNVAATNVTITDPGGNTTPLAPVVGPSSLTMAPMTAAAMAPGTTLALSVSASPDYADASVTWSSSDTAVATVDTNGKVTALSAGSATITATANAAFGSNAAADAQCAITVVGASHVAEAGNNSFSVGGGLSQTAGKAFSITATGDRQNEAGAVVGDTRYIPVSASANPTVNFAQRSSGYTAQMTIDTAGTYILTVTYQLQAWNGSGWDDVANSTDIQSATLIISAAGTVATATATTTPSTGDGSSVMPWAALLLASLVLFGVAVRKKTARA